MTLSDWEKRESMKLTQPQSKTQLTAFFTVFALSTLVKASFFHKSDAVGSTVYQLDTGNITVMISPNIVFLCMHFSQPSVHCVYNTHSVWCQC